FGAGHSQINAGPLLAQRLRTVSGVLDRFPSYLQQQTLLRVHATGFPRCDAEEVGIEQVHLVQKPGPSGSYFGGRIRVGIVILGSLPAGIRYIDDRVDSIREQAPKRIRVFGAGEPAAYAHHGDGLGAVPLGCLDAPLHLLDRQQGLLERRQVRETGRSGIRRRHNDASLARNSASTSASSRSSISPARLAMASFASLASAPSAVNCKTSWARYPAIASVVG